MTKPKLLMTTTMLDQLNISVEDRFEVLRAQRIDDLEPILAADGSAIVAVCCGGASARIDDAVIARLPALKVIANFGVGYDGVDTAASAARGIIVTNTPDVLNEEVADTALGLLLMTVRELGKSEQYLRDGRWAREGDYPLTPQSLRDRSVGIVGLGRIGRAIAHRCEAFGLPISYFGRTAKDDVAYTFYQDLKDMAEAVDTLILITPATPETKHMINAEVLEALGSRGVVINVARGAVVDETALITALRAGTIWGAGLDVMWNEPAINTELMHLPNTVLLPHVGSASIHTRRAMARLVRDNLTAYLDGLPPPTPVPETPFSTW